MRRIKQAKPSAALIVAVIALVAALGGGAVAGVAVTSLKQNERKQVKKISKRQAKKLDKKIALTPGPKGDQGLQGEQGPKGDQGLQGDPGEDATHLFAYIQDTGNTDDEAALGYGDGAVSVSDPDGDNSITSPGPYVVTFDRDLSECVANATTGRGDPAGVGTGSFIAPTIATVKGATVEVAALTSGGFKDTSFMLSVVC